MMNTKLTIVALAAAMTLSACGGGGSSTTAAVPPAQQPGQPQQPMQPQQPAGGSVSTATNVVTTVPAASYMTASNEAVAFQKLNAFRASLGLGLFAQNAKLDLAAKNHVAYVSRYSKDTGGTIDMSSINPTTGQLQAHSEDVGMAGFTGALPPDRAAYAMYTPDPSISVREEVGYTATAVEALLDTVFHRASLMNQAPRDVGIAFAADSVLTNVFEFGLAKGASAQQNASTFTAAYPVDGATGIPLYTLAEAPNPYPDLAVTSAAFASGSSSPISFISEDSTTLAVTSFTVTEAGQTTALPVRLITKSTNSTTQTYLTPNVAFIAGYAPFKSKTVYNVSFVGTVNGTAVTKNWSFTTL